jgi:outer membrane receptor for ferrienterochelin and colicin
MKAIFVIICFLSIAAANGQMLKGKVFGEDAGSSEKEILPGASLVWVGTNIGTTANENGVFSISSQNIEDKRLAVSFVGFVPDTISIGESTYISVTLKANKTEMQEVVIQGERQSSYISPIAAIKTEVITQRELTKAACCDLAGCFDTQVSVQPQTTNVITNSKELRILGLSGVYNQLLFDGMPMIQGPLATYIVSSYPGSLIDNIFVTKGTNSVLQGFESISGQINLEPKLPDKTDKLFVNAYMNSFLEKQVNVNFSSGVSKNGKWSSLTALHTAQPGDKIDRDDDRFLDIPLLTRYMLYNHVNYGNSKYSGYFLQGGIRLLQENRVGGQNSFDAEKQKGSNAVYGQSVNYFQPEINIKTGVRFSDDHLVALTLSTYFHDQDAYFGTVKYDVSQLNAYLNLQHEWLWREKHLLKYGISYRWQDLKETISFTDTSLVRTYNGIYETPQSVPGSFIENAFHWNNDKIILLIGARLDHHQKFGYYFTPRSLLKVNLGEHHTLRASAGTGWRQVNMFSENINLLVSSRDIIFREELNPEKAFNWGMNYLYRFKLPAIEGSMSMDFYQTLFQSQFFPDYDTDPNFAYIENYTGESVSNAFQVETNVKFFKSLELKVAYNFLDVYRVEDGNKIVLPFNSKNRVMAAISYRTKKNNWYFDLNSHWYDKQRLPSTASNPEEYRFPDYSDAYYIINCQVTRRIKQFEIYSGVENLFNFRQVKPIISWQDPFSRYFDTSFAWGPTRGREFYLGIRWKINRK